VTLDCGPGGGAIAAVDFASFGRPTGNCGAYAAAPACDAPGAKAVVEALCLGKAACVVPTAPGGAFGTPCAGDTWLAVQARCSGGAAHTYWNFTLPDAFISDFWDAVRGNLTDPIINFSTEPSWIYGSDYSWAADPNKPNYGYARGSAASVNNTALGEYYGRLYAYFKTNSMVDEAGVTHTRTSGPPLDIRTIEVFNEVDYEHGYDEVTYTESFDAVVRGVRAAADPAHAIKFVGLSLPNIDDEAKVATWTTYFLNASNHAADTADALDYIGYHAYPTNGGYTKDPATFERLFDYADTFIEGVLKVDAIIAALSPRTRTVLDETGTDMDGVLGAGPPPGNAPRYWAASAGYFAYMFARAANESATVVQVGASQLMDAPGQEPSVTLVDWVTGGGTARAWVVKLLADAVAVGDAAVATTAAAAGGGAPADAVFAMGFARAGGARSLLLVNKRNADVDVTTTCGGAPCACSRALVLDEFSGLAPARDAPCAGGRISLAPFATAMLDVA
jgi:hypothetical protein